jgi:hypothetical protein
MRGRVELFFSGAYFFHEGKYHAIKDFQRHKEDFLEYQSVSVKIQLSSPMHNIKQNQGEAEAQLIRGRQLEWSSYHYPPSSADYRHGRNLDD